MKYVSGFIKPRMKEEKKARMRRGKERGEMREEYNKTT